MAQKQSAMVVHYQISGSMLVKLLSSKSTITKPFKCILSAPKRARTPVTTRNTSEPIGRCPELVIERAATILKQDLCEEIHSYGIWEY
eukprot:914471-Pleurochrysis_carterae.AAC.1